MIAVERSWGLFFFGVAPDVMSHEGTNWDNTAAKAAVKRGIVDPHAAEHGDAIRLAEGAIAAGQQIGRRVQVEDRARACGGHFVHRTFDLVERGGGQGV